MPGAAVPGGDVVVVVAGGVAGGAVVDAAEVSRVVAAKSVAVVDELSSEEHAEAHAETTSAATRARTTGRPRSGRPRSRRRSVTGPKLASAPHGPPAQRAARDARPVPWRLPVVRRAPDRAHTEPRRPRRRRDPPRPPLQPGRPLRARAGRALHRHVPDEQPRRRERLTARRAVRQHRARRAPRRLRTCAVRVHGPGGRSSRGDGPRRSAPRLVRGDPPRVRRRLDLTRGYEPFLSWLESRGHDVSPGLGRCSPQSTSGRRTTACPRSSPTRLSNGSVAGTGPGSRTSATCGHTRRTRRRASGGARTTPPTSRCRSPRPRSATRSTSSRRRNPGRCRGFSDCLPAPRMHTPG